LDVTSKAVEVVDVDMLAHDSLLLVLADGVIAAGPHDVI